MSITEVLNTPGTRREFLTYALLAGEAAAAVVIADGVQNKPQIKYSSESVAGLITRIAPGQIVVERGVNIRDYPSVPRFNHRRLLLSRLYPSSNVIPWDSIVEINGVARNGANMFVVENPGVVRGEDTYGDYGFRGNNSTGDWMRLRVRQAYNERPAFGFINLSYYTSDHVKPVEGEFVYASSIVKIAPGGQLILENGAVVEKSKFDKIIVDPKYNSFRDLWAEQMSKKLDGETPLEQYEKRYAEVKVVPVSTNPEDLAEKCIAGGVVPVYEMSPYLYPSDQMVEPYYLSYDTRIRDLILMGRTSDGIFYRGSVLGDVRGRDNESVNLDPRAVLTIEDNYILSTSSKIRVC